MTLAALNCCVGQAPVFLKRNLSYVEPAFDLFIPLAARMLVLPSAADARWSAGLQLPITLPHGGSLDGLAVVVLLRRSDPLARLLRLACRGVASKEVTCSLAEGAAFRWLLPGDELLCSVVRPRPGQGEGAPPHDGAIQGGQCRLQIHMPQQQPASSGNSGNSGASTGSGVGATNRGGPALPVPAFSLAKQAGAGFQLGFSLSFAAAASSQHQWQQGGAGGLAGAKRKRPEAAAAGSAREPQADARAAGVPPVAQQEQQEQQEQEAPAVRVYYCSTDGGRVLRQEQAGFHCPFSVCGLVCRGYAGLRQHLQASHLYHEFYFAPPDPATGTCEVFARCHPAWFDRRGGFLPKAMRELALEDSPLLRLLMRTPVHCTFAFHCPRAQRGRRFSGAGEYPQDAAEQAFLAEASCGGSCAVWQGVWDGGLALEQLRLAEEEAGDGRPGRRQGPLRMDSLSDLFRSSLVTSSATTTASEGEEMEEMEEEDEEVEWPGGRRRGRRRQRGGKAKVRPLRAGGGAAAAPRLGAGLELLTRDGRPRFYHSKTCTALSLEELLGGEDSGNESDFSDWQRDCRERLGKCAELCTEQQDFMYAWNLHVHRNPIHADADVGASLAAFAGAQAARLAGDTPFRRCFTAYLLNLWKFRLLSPAQLHELTAALPSLL
eukprot:scaffold15.g4290.t1